MKTRINTAIYVDAENVGGTLNIKQMFNALILGNPIDDDENREIAFVIKAVYGRQESLKKIAQEFVAYNFEIKETPSIGHKNRADLIISVDAFEDLYIQNPKIDRFVFVTNDSDFTVVMDKLRKYGSEVWLVTTQKEDLKDIFNNSCDKIIYSNKINNDIAAENQHSELVLEDEELINKLYGVLITLDRGKSHLSSFIGNKLHQIDKSLDFSKTKYKGLDTFLRNNETKFGYITKTNEKGHLEIVIKQDGLKNA